VIPAGTAVVTGAGGGLGRALAIRAARDGRAVGIGDVAVEGLAETERLVREAGVGCTAAVFDVRDESETTAFAASLPGPIGLVVANAGILRFGTIAEMNLASVRLLFEVNVLGLLATVRAFLPRLAEQGSPSRLVLVGSGSSFASGAEGGAYSATKHAVWALGWALREELEREDSPIQVSVLAPGTVATGIFRRADARSEDLLAPVTRPGEVDAISAEEAIDTAYRLLGTGAFLVPTHLDYLPEVIRLHHDRAMESLPS
jgi:short-subunit dehydrogenase